MKAYSRLVLNIPHSSALLPKGTKYASMDQLLEDNGKWTDHYTDLLFLPSPDLSQRCKIHRFPFSRFYIDAERLPEDDLVRKDGIVYTEFNGNRRSLTEAERQKLMGFYRAYIEGFELAEGDLLVDCHSFPSDLADNSICIGFNEDASKPSAAVLEMLAATFRSAGFEDVRFNEPYSNSLTPAKPYTYHSVMIEVNKKAYMDEETLLLHPGHLQVRKAIGELYRKLLGG